MELGNGWWNLTPLNMWFHFEMWKILAQGVPCVMATLEIENDLAMVDKTIRAYWEL